MTVEISDDIANTGDNICLPILVHNFDSIVSLQYSINYDDTHLSYTGNQNLNLANLNASNIGNPSAGNITFSWLTDDFVDGTTVADDTAIFDLCFDVTGSDVTSTLDVSGSPTAIEDAPADDYNCANNPKLVRYTFTPEAAEASSDYAFTNITDKDQSLKILGGKNPAQTWLENNGVQIGNTYACVRAEIQSGTCTPVVFTIKDLDLMNSTDCD